MEKKTTSNNPVKEDKGYSGDVKISESYHNELNKLLKENESLKERIKELEEGFRELQLDCVGNDLMPKTPKIVTIRKAQFILNSTKQ